MIGWSATGTGPYTSALLISTTRSVFAETAASMTDKLPSAFTRNVSNGACHDPPTSLQPARWKSASGRCASDRSSPPVGVEEIGTGAQVEPDHVRPGSPQFPDQVRTDEAAGTGDEGFHRAVIVAAEGRAVAESWRRSRTRRER